jgi:hypothetical protein
MNLDTAVLSARWQCEYCVMPFTSPEEFAAAVPRMSPVAFVAWQVVISTNAGTNDLLEAFKEPLKRCLEARTHPEVPEQLTAQRAVVTNALHGNILRGVDQVTPMLSPLRLVWRIRYFWREGVRTFEDLVFASDRPLDAVVARVSDHVLTVREVRAICPVQDSPDEALGYATFFKLLRMSLHCVLPSVTIATDYVEGPHIRLTDRGFIDARAEPREFHVKRTAAEADPIGLIAPDAWDVLWFLFHNVGQEDLPLPLHDRGVHSIGAIADIILILHERAARDSH